MNFTSIIYLPFLIITVGLFYGLKRERSRLWLLLAMSYIFYAWWDPRFLLLVMLVSGVNYVAGKQIHASAEPRRRKQLLGLSVTATLGVLAYFKYSNFFVASLVSALNVSGLDLTAPSFRIVLPLGISFYIFMALSYTIDIYRGTLNPTASALKFFTYVAFFPQIMAGPITRAANFLPQLDELKNKQLREEGLIRILYGLSKKLLLADSLGRLVVDPVFAAPANFQGIPALLAAYAYAFQIYLDFSAYTDIAIGSAALLGFDLPENFRAPYRARSAKEYWSKWHISLSTWFRDYVYIPLGGNRQGERRTRYNMLATFLLSGLWHGAGLTYLFWGLLHGCYLIAYRLNFVKGLMARMPGLAQQLIFFNLTALAWVFFRSANMDQAWQVLAAVFSYSAADAYNAAGLMLWAIGLVTSAALVHALLDANLARLGQAYNRLPAIGRGAVVYALALAVYCGAQFDFVHQTFVYFRF